MMLLLDTAGRCDEPVTAAEPVGGSARSLDEVLSGAWDALLAAAPAACPVCGDAMTPRWSAGAGVVGGRCGNCGSDLA